MEASGATPGSVRAHVFVGELADPRLDPAGHHHLTRVLRLPVGTPITVCDGHGGWRVARLQDGLSASAAGPVVRDPRPRPQVTVAFALVKGQRPELVVQKLTELGVDRIVPFVAARSVVRWDAAKAARNVERWGAIARESAMQCRRTHLPDVAPVTDFAGAAATPAAALADREGGPPSLDLPALLIGPEGGWSPEERAAGLPTIRLGAHVLRAETAAITAGAILTALRGSVVRHMIPAQ